jgi:hypothetical protein
MGRRHRGQRYEPPHQRGRVSQQAIQSERRADGGARRQGVRRHELLVGGGDFAASVGVTDEGVVGLVEPLPEDHSRGGLVVGHHPSREHSVHRELRRGSREHRDGFARLGVVTRVVQSLGSPQILLGDIFREGFSASVNCGCKSGATVWDSLVFDVQAAILLEFVAADEQVARIGELEVATRAPPIRVLVVRRFV